MTCVICGVEFAPKNPKRPPRTCSRACTNTMVWRAGRPHGGPKPRPREIANCLYCGKPVKWAQRPGRQGKYCSRVCVGRAKGRSAIYIDPDGRARVNLRDGSKQWYARCLMEGHLKRHLCSDEIVHHINGDRSDDRIENLQVVSRAEHGRIHGPEAGAIYGKLTREQVAEIVGTETPYRELAERFGVTEGAIRYHRRKASLLRSQSRAA